MIRPYLPDDLEQLLDVWYRASLVAHPFLSKEFFATERRLIAEQWIPRSETIVFEQDGNVIGFLSMNGNEVGALFVDPGHHRRGIGRALMDEVRATHPYLELEVFAGNTLGRRFYEAYGFEEVGRHDEANTGQPALRLKMGGE